MKTPSDSVGGVGERRLILCRGVLDETCVAEEAVTLVIEERKRGNA